MPIRGAVISTITLILILLATTVFGGAIPYDTICSNSYYTIRGNSPISDDIPHHFAWVVSSDGGATWRRIPNSNHRDLTITEPLAGMSNMQVRRYLYKRYVFSPSLVSESEIVGLVVASGYSIDRTEETITPCILSQGFTVTTPLPSVFDWRCTENQHTILSVNTPTRTSSYKVRMNDLKSNPEDFPSGSYNLDLTIRTAWGCSEVVRMKVTVNNSTVQPFASTEVAYSYNNNDALPLNRSWGGVDRQQWRIMTSDIGNLTVEEGTGILRGISRTFMPEVIVDAVCADYPDRHYAMRIQERSRDFAYIGSGSEIYLPHGKYAMDCWGAQSGRGAYGGHSSGILDISTQGRTFFVYVGSNGGWNGGGYDSYDGRYGGGASDFRLTGGAWNDAAGLRSRIMVAGGGGSNGHTGSGTGGAGGGLVGINGSSSVGVGGSQTAAGRAGGFGYGGNGTGHGGGGGGGYYGGGAGTSCAYGGGGGSSFISGYPGCNAVNTAGSHTGQPNHYSGLTFEDLYMEQGVRGGNGYARIRYMDYAVDGDYKKVKNFGPYRAWRDGTFAKSAYAYRYPTGGYNYRGDIGSGIYRIDPDGPSGTIQPIDVYCDMETDGGGWTLLFHHHINGGYWSGKDASKYNVASPTANLYSILYLTEYFRAADGKFLFWLNYPTLSGRDNVWKQTANPTTITNLNTTGSAAGYQAVRVLSTGDNWGGLARSDNNASYLDGQWNVNYWWFSIGCYSVYEGSGMPGPNNIIVPQVRLWVK